MTLLRGDRMQVHGDPLVQGDSGSPVVQDGRVVGVVKTGRRFARVDTAVAAMRRMDADRERLLARAPHASVSRY